MDAASSPPNVRQTFGRRLGLTARQWRRAIDQRLQPFGLTEATLWPLLHVAQGGEPMRQKHLAATLGIETSTLVRLIDALDKAGLVERQTCGDRRAWTLHATARGRALAEQVEAAIGGIRAQVLGDISDAELATTLAVFERISAGLAGKRLPQADGAP